ncbi:YdcF family protein [Cyclobacterium sp. 1_MG-2023]|uniref:YdcF family protein n=1 Tax=Cyclobacterium sp. 1_MG-2023 TaxID=3062681 RepID=UPI0026E2818C|nr:YdcF family protein [Cyclobacterium sp. 1_MG-2023]MDO6439687.1 YdcF family protein [Cyclobacterium sp. 1_MG-2023]
MLDKIQPAITSEIKTLTKVLWDYHQVNHTLNKADAIFVLGSHDTRVAERGAQLWLAGMADYLILSGGLGNFTLGVWEETEADKFAKIALNMGVPESSIIVENKSTNTGENIQFTQKIIKEKGLDFNRFIIVQKPYMERRSYATFKKNWPEKSVTVTSPNISFDNYPNEEISMGIVIQSMVGDLQRIKEYPKLGFQIEQEIPQEVWQAFEQLVKLGFDQHLIKE